VAVVDVKGTRQMLCLLFRFYFEKLEKLLVTIVKHFGRCWRNKESGCQVCDNNIKEVIIRTCNFADGRMRFSLFLATLEMGVIGASSRILVFSIMFFHVERVQNAL
jgi:hypothetical protein